MPRFAAICYDIALVLAGLGGLLPLAEEASGNALSHRGPVWAARLSSLKELSSVLIVVFVALLVGRVVMNRRKVTAEPRPDMTGLSKGIDFSGMDRDDPRTYEIIKKHIDEEGRNPAVEIISLVDQVLSTGAFLGASDIHIEPKAKNVRVSFRVDGVLRDLVAFPKQLEHQIINRLKIASNLDISKTDAPQDGRFQSRVADKAMNLRVSIFPTLHGEKAVIRILDSKRSVMRLDEFGFQEETLEELRRLLKAPQGLLLFTGPTGSGKTSLLYACIKEIIEAEEGRRNVTTLEDPIEHELEDINQSQVDVKRGLTFAVGLRTLLRQDPDVIMLGEIRDLETGKIALQAAQTGHLILSTIHANSSSSAFGRLIDLGTEPFLLASAVSGVAAQRLVRRICPHCRVRRDPPAALLEQIGFPSGTDAEFFEGAGCAECGNTGFSGRLPVFELLKMNEQVADAVLRKGSAGEILKAARARGMITLLEDGLVKVQEGHTSLIELLRVVQ